MSSMPEEFVLEDRYMSKKKIVKVLGNLFGPEDGKWYKEVFPYLLVFSVRVGAYRLFSKSVIKLE